MSAGSYKALIDVLRKHCLLEPPRLAELTEILARQRPDPKSLVKLLLEGGWLTAYQVKQLSKGKGQDLHLNQYVLLEPIGVGGMGQVYKARHIGLNRLVALKIIRKDRLTDAEAVLRFQREIEVVAQLTHPNIVLAYDADQIGDRLFLAMEYVPGVDVARLLKRSGAFKIHEACEVVRQTALGLQHAFERGLVHRDVKPSNLLLFRAPVPGSTGSGAKARVLQVKILDLGLARLRPELESRHSTSVTQEGLVLGTLDYISPEQAANASQVDIRADLYSLGCTFYHMLAGEVPFPGGSAVEKVCRHQTAVLPPLRQHRADIAPALAIVVERLLAKHPGDRYQTPAELVAALTEAQTKGEPSPAPSTTLDRPHAPESVETTVSMDAETLALGSSWAEFIISTQAPTTAPVRSAGKGGRALRIGLTSILLTAVGMGIWLWKETRQTTGIRQSGSDEGAQLAAGAREVPRSTITVDANRAWQDTYVDVREGVAVTILAQGEWRGPRGKSTALGISVDARSRNVLPEAPYLCLVGRIGSDGKPFALEAEKTIFPLESGRLFVQANTLDLGKLSGHLTITIQGGRPRSAAATPPKPSALEATEEAWRPLLGAHGQPKTLTPSDRQLVQFVLDHPGTPQALQTRDWLCRLPSRFDKFSQDQIAKEDLPKTPISELVAVYRPPMSGTTIRSFAFTPDGASLAALYADGSLVFWDASKRTMLSQRKLGSGGETTMAFSPTGQLLATAGNGDSITLWGSTGDRELGTLPASGYGSLASLAFSPDGSMVLGVGNGRRAPLWDINTRHIVAALRESEIVLGQGKTPDADRTLRLWLVRGRAMEAIPGRRRPGLVAISPFSMFAAFFEGPALAVYDLSRAQVHARCQEAPKDLFDVAFSPDGQLLAASGADGSIRIWEPLTGQLLSSLDNTAGAANQLDFSPDGHSLLTLHGAKKLLQVWDVSTGQCVRRIPVVDGAHRFVWEPFGKHIAIPGERGCIYLLRWAS